MFEKSTAQLAEILKHAKPEDLSKILKENRREIIDDEKAFYYYVKETLADKGITLTRVYVQAGVSEKWGGKVIRQEKHVKNRDLILRLLIAGHFTVEELDRALKLYGMSPLTGRNIRDNVIVCALHNRIFRLDQIDDMLQKQNLPILSSFEN